jgi:hypothetical protein
MIVPLDLADDETAKAVHRIATQSYTVEAELIGSTAIPGLHESVEDVRGLPLRWLGFARRLVEQVLAEGGPAIVSTGAANAPAIALYEGLGFRLVDTVVVEGGLRIAQFGHPGLI